DGPGLRQVPPAGIENEPAQHGDEPPRRVQGAEQDAAQARSGAPAAAPARRRRAPRQHPAVRTPLAHRTGAMGGPGPPKPRPAALYRVGVDCGRPSAPGRPEDPGMSTAVTRRSFTDAELAEIAAVRRDLHAHPELAFEETRTAARVAGRLRALGLEPRTGVGKTGVLATVSGGRPGPTVLLRADMDALPIQEENDVPYRSSVPGRMHACGHDCHTAVLLGVAKHLARDAATLPGAVRLCFQPAEETGGGAEAMIRDGALEAPRPDAAFGLHVWQTLDLGKVGITPGPFMAAVDEFTVTVTGVGSHAAMPHLGVDPVVCIAHMIAALQSIASRRASPLLEVVVSVTQVRAGTAFNIIPG